MKFENKLKDQKLKEIKEIMEKFKIESLEYIAENGCDDVITDGDGDKDFNCNCVYATADGCINSYLNEKDESYNGLNNIAVGLPDEKKEAQKRLKPYKLKELLK